MVEAVGGTGITTDLVAVGGTGITARATGGIAADPVIATAGVRGIGGKPKCCCP